MDKKQYFGRQMFLGMLFPAFVSGLALALSDVADALVVGARVGELGLAAVGIVTPIYMVYNIIGYGYSIGTSVSCSRLTAAGKPEEAQSQFLTVFRVMIFWGLVIAVIGNLLMGPLMTLLGAAHSEADLRILCIQYARPLITFAPIMLINYLFYAILRADDDQYLAMLSFASGCILDLGLNILFVLVFHWGVMGAGYATVIAQTVSVLIAIPHFFRDKGAISFKGNLLFRPADFKVALPLFLTGFSTSVRYIFQFCFLVLTNNLLMKAEGINNTLYTAVFDVVMNVSYVAYSLYEATGEALQPVAATFFEERDRENVYYVRRLAFLWGTGCSLVLALLLGFFAAEVSAIFGLGSPEALAVSVPAIRVFCVASVFGGTMIILISFYQSVEKERLAAQYTALRSFLVLMPVTLYYGLVQTELFFCLFPLTEIISWGVAFLLMPNTNVTGVLKDARVYSRTLENNDQDIWDVLAGLVEFCNTHGAKEEQNYLVNLVIEEISLQIIRQTFTGRPHEYIQITLSAEPNGDFIMHLRNSAARFNPFDQKQVAKEDDEDENILNSLGVIMVKAKAKEFNYRTYSGYNLLTVVM